MVRRSVPVAVACALFFLMLLVTAPARLASWLVPAEQVYLGGLDGTIREGRAATAAVAVPGGWLRLGRLHWHLSEWSLLMLSPRLQFESQWGQQRLKGLLSVAPTGTLKLHQLDSRFAAELVRQLLPVQLRGEFSLLANNVVIRNGAPEAGRGRLLWQRGLWLGNSSSQALGDYLLEFTIDGPMQARGKVSTLQGPVQVAGTVALSERRYAIDLSLRSESGFGPELGSALQLMAAPVENGYQLSFSAEF